MKLVLRNSIDTFDTVVEEFSTLRELALAQIYITLEDVVRIPATIAFLWSLTIIVLCDGNYIF